MNSSQMDRQTALPFLGIATLWLVVAIAISARFPHGAMTTAIAWAVVLWTVCLVDLYALSRAVGALLELAAMDSEKRGPWIIQAFVWGLVKLICLGILAMILIYGSSIPSASLLTGTGTLVVVPLIGGYRWSQKVIRHAS